MKLARTEVQRRVEERAQQRCEYCLMHQSLQGASFHIEHVIPVSLEGTEDLDNLAWACPGCNLKKSNRVMIHDPETGKEVRVFHPRLDRWEEHFAWQEYSVLGLTPIGRALVAAFDLNHERRLRIRQAEEIFDLFVYTAKD